MNENSFFLRMLTPLVLSFCICLAAGCGSGDPDTQRYLVKGTVTVDGKPLAKGRITFESAVKGTFDSAEIKNGSYELTSTPGKKTVRISRPIVKTVKLSTGEMEKIEQETLPSRYNKASTHTKEIFEDESKNQFDFKVTSK